jgi:hypothetical protein
LDKRLDERISLLLKLQNMTQNCAVHLWLRVNQECRLVREHRLLKRSRSWGDRRSRNGARAVAGWRRGVVPVIKYIGLHEKTFFVKKKLKSQKNFN